MIRKMITLLLAAGMISACAPANLEAPAVSITEQPTEMPVPTVEDIQPTATARVASSWRLEQVAQDLEIPWSIVFTGPERMLVSERTGRVREVLNGQLNPDALYVFSDVTSLEEAGLMGMALDPEYEDNRYIYACYARGAVNGLMDRVVRLRDLGDQLELESVILDGIPSAQYHAGCRIQFGPDGKLYVTTGDALQPQDAQNPDSLAGKILRINPDGSIPADNPFADSAVYSYGHRNPQGIAWQAGQRIALFHGAWTFRL